MPSHRPNPKEHQRVALYDGVRQPWFLVAEVGRWLASRAPSFRVDLPGPLPLGGRAPADAERRLCRMRVRDPMRPPPPREPLKPELDYEARLLAVEARPTKGVIYDGNELQRLAYCALPPERRVPEVANVWFTERAVATWDEDDRRYHLRVCVLGQPAIVSTTGMVVAPARERAAYLARRLGLPPDAAGDGEDRLRFEEPRLTEAAKGYAMQAVLFALAGEKFCNTPRCRLYNAHWQAEVLAAQFSEPEFCERHEGVLAGLGSKRS